MSYQYDLGQQQYPVNFGTVDPAQVAGYTVAAANTAKDESKVTDGLGLMSVFTAGTGAYKVAKYAKNTNTSVTDVIKSGIDKAKNDVGVLKKAFTSSDKAAEFAKIANSNKIGQEIFELQAALPSPKKLEKMSKEAQASYSKLSKILSKASNAKTLATKEKYLKQSKALLENISGKSASKAAGTVAKAVESTTAKTAAKTGSKLLKAVKGNALFLAIEGATEMFTNVIPTFKQLGAKSGAKQVLKSGIKVAASIGGWQAGAALGAAIGSVIPGAGTAVGAVVGSVIGIGSSLICSAAATKVAKAIVGKDELELAEEKQQATQSQQSTKPQTTAISNQDLLNQVGIQNPTTSQTAQTTQQALYNPYTGATNFYTTQDTADNLLMMPLKAGLQFRA